MCYTATSISSNVTSGLCYNFRVIRLVPSTCFIAISRRQNLCFRLTPIFILYSVCDSELNSFLAI
ncbi:hypothetical protein F383_34265 [Gossypium arboreum]|uniref:Uncharacterized protein n=1 Tax=Gossypium arboreum TaxID=29729 RepID=A0A0B0PRL1_GOSAR|nr:hypothetical protein F383_34265 [Gossypium arboreum]